jgi:hypothetical protein
MFDASKEFEVKIISGGEKSCRVRYPNDDEWEWRTSRMKAIRRDLGRGKSQTEIPHPELIDAELLAKIRLDGVNGDAPPAFDPAEAQLVIERIGRCMVTDVARDGANFRIKTKTVSGMTEHVVGIPTAQAVLDLRRGTMSPIEGRRGSEIRFSLRPSGALYDQVKVDTVNYTNGVPLIHKDAVVYELMAQVGMLEDNEDPED